MGNAKAKIIIFSINYYLFPFVRLILTELSIELELELDINSG